MFRGLNAVDDNVGKLLKLLDELKLADDTVFVFSSDNGYYLGEHNLGDKRSAYEEAMRIPMLVRYPRLAAAGRTDDRLVLNVDPAATFLELAGQPVPAAMHGRSWRPLLAGKTDAPWREAFFYCYFYERGFGTPTTTAIRTADAKLIKYPGHAEWTEVFDLKADPYETRNLAAQHPDITARLLARLQAWDASLQPPGLPTETNPQDQIFFSTHVEKTLTPPAADPAAPQAKKKRKL
jgi:arylsulfatase A-like enzyme